MSEELLPGFTILMSTYNSGARLGRALERVRRQDYPGELMQIVVADGGSTDRTIDIADSYGATVVDNQLRLGEEGLRAGMPRVERELVVIFADDNEFAQDDWLSTVAGIFEENKELDAFFCRLGASDDDPPANKYYALIENEPLNFYMNQSRLLHPSLNGKATGHGGLQCIRGRPLQASRLGS